MKKIFCLSLLLFVSFNHAYSHVVILYHEGKPSLGIRYPEDWKQTIEDSAIKAVSPDGLVWSAFTGLKDIKNLEEGETLIKTGFSKDFLEPTFEETQTLTNESRLISGSAKNKTSDKDVKFASIVFTAGETLVATITFVFDPVAEELYKTTILDICESILLESDLNTNNEEE